MVMIKSIVMVLLTMTMFSGSQKPDMTTYRSLMDKSVNDEKIAKQFYSLTNRIQISDEPVIVGVKAMSELIMCKHVFNPVSKISHFNRGKKLLDNAISRSTTNPELLFFRFATQSNVPALLNYNANLQADKLILISYLKVKTSDTDLHNRIRSYMLQNKYCNAREKELIKTL
jgi:hypothetical protein